MRERLPDIAVDVVPDFSADALRERAANIERVLAGEPLVDEIGGKHVAPGARSSV